jgi:DNA-binding GntR family transcriptional regulator
MNSVFGTALVAESLADKVLSLVMEAIERGDLAPGNRIREATLARQLGISRGPLREALARLEGRKILQYTPNLGMRVAEVDLKDVIEIFEMREALEGMAVRLATQNMSDDELDQIAKLLEEHRKTVELKKGSAYYQRAGELDLHFRIAQGAGNQRLANILCQDFYYFLRIHRYRSSETPGRAAKALNEHKAIIAAMRKRNANLAEELMRKHIRAALDNLKNSEAATKQRSAR